MEARYPGRTGTLMRKKTILNTVAMVDDNRAGRERALALGAACSRTFSSPGETGDDGSSSDDEGEEALSQRKRTMRTSVKKPMTAPTKYQVSLARFNWRAFRITRAPAVEASFRARDSRMPLMVWGARKGLALEDKPRQSRSFIESTRELEHHFGQTSTGCVAMNKSKI